MTDAPHDHAADEGIWLLYRHKTAAPIGHSALRLPDVSVLALFRRLFVETRAAFETGGEKALVRHLHQALGRFVYGLSSVFTKACARPLSLPESDRDLYELLLQDLYVECPRSELTSYIRFDDGALRVRTDDDEVELAYAFVPARNVRHERGRWAWWTFAGERLPETVIEGTWAPSFEVWSRPLGGVSVPERASEGRTWAVLLTSYDSQSFDVPGVFVIDGVRLPELGRVLREARPVMGARDVRWPYELRLLRAMVAPGEADVLAALARCAEFPVQKLGGRSEPAGDNADAEAAFDAYVVAAGSALAMVPPARSKWSIVAGSTPEQRASKGVAAFVDVGEHRAMLCSSGGWKYFDQWVLFDDLWAKANPALADALLVFASTWDPCSVIERADS